MGEKCLFCDSPGDYISVPDSGVMFKCPVCGDYALTTAAYDAFSSRAYGEPQKRIMGIHIRDAWEKRRAQDLVEPFSLADLEAFMQKGRPTPLELIDQALVRFNNHSNIITGYRAVDVRREFLFYQCTSREELVNLLRMLVQEGWVEEYSRGTPQEGLRITAKGYTRLRELQQINQDSRQGFVAMWYAHEMDAPYELAIKPAIEFVEEDQSEPVFRAVRVDNVQHVNDINDEMIAQIRRSRFLVCDLTGHRGGVYFEAGFAFGLGLPVIYTCRQDWCQADDLLDAKRNKIVNLYDPEGNEIPVKKEGIHFDLAHRNHIVWQADKLDQFRIDLENRIKAVIA